VQIEANYAEWLSNVCFFSYFTLLDLSLILQSVKDKKFVKYESDDICKKKVINHSKLLSHLFIKQKMMKCCLKWRWNGYYHKRKHEETVIVYFENQTVDERKAMHIK